MSPPSCWRRTPNDPTEVFSAHELERSRRYQRPLARLRFLRAVLGLAVLVAIVWVQAAPRLADALGISGWVARSVVVIVALTSVSMVYDVPLDAWVDLVHDRRWGLSTQTGRGLAMDEVKSAAFEVVLAAAVVVPLYAVIRASTWWWLWGWALVVGFMVLFGFLFPVVIAPVFNRFTPLADAPLVDRLHALAERAGVRMGGVYVVDESRRSRRDNAYVTGLGATRRVVLYDTILEHTPEMVEQVVAHEFGHLRRHHLRRELPLVAGIALVGFAVLRLLAGWDALWSWAGVAGIGDPTGLPVLLLVTQVGGAVAGVLLAWVSRVFERQADLDALDLLRRPDDTVEMLRCLHVKNLADLAPGRVARLRTGHPTAAERVAFARAWGAVGAVHGERAITQS